MKNTNSTSIDGLYETLGATTENEGSQWFTVKLKVRFYQILKLKHTTKHS